MYVNWENSAKILVMNIDTYNEFYYMVYFIENNVLSDKSNITYNGYKYTKFIDMVNWLVIFYKVD